MKCEKCKEISAILKTLDAPPTSSDFDVRIFYVYQAIEDIRRVLEKSADTNKALDKFIEIC